MLFHKSLQYIAAFFAIGIGVSFIFPDLVYLWVALIVLSLIGIVAMRFGLTDGQPKTLDEIGKVHGVTRERIRQIEAKALRKLRHPSRADIMRSFLDSDNP